MTPEDRAQLETLEYRLEVLLPEEYQGSYEDLQPTPMRSAGLKYDTDGRVAWDQIWGSFCDLAMAGGPPHKGALLEPASASVIDANLERYAEVTDEICRGITLATDLDARPAPAPGWVRAACYSRGMAGWLLRAITMENVAVRADGLSLDLPASPHFRLEKEIKNVVTVMAKTCHYWLGHMPTGQRGAIADLFTEMEAESPLVVPGLATDAAAARITQVTGLAAVAGPRYAGWLGLECSDVRTAIWAMRAAVCHNLLARRETTALFVPLNDEIDPAGEIVAGVVKRVYHLAQVSLVRLKPDTSKPSSG